jgi:hypothetical protein
MIIFRRTEANGTQLSITVPQTYNPGLIADSFRLIENGEAVAPVNNTARGLPWSRTRGPNSDAQYANDLNTSRLQDVSSDL